MEGRGEKGKEEMKSEEGRKKRKEFLVAWIVDRSAYLLTWMTGEIQRTVSHLKAITSPELSPASLQFFLSLPLSLSLFSRSTSSSSSTIFSRAVDKDRDGPIRHNSLDSFGEHICIHSCLRRIFLKTWSRERFRFPSRLRSLIRCWFYLTWFKFSRDSGSRDNGQLVLLRRVN